MRKIQKQLIDRLAKLGVELCEAALELLASAVSVDESGRKPVQRWYGAFPWSRALTVSGGASESLRGLMGPQLLGMPGA